MTIRDLPVGIGQFQVHREVFYFGVLELVAHTCYLLSSSSSCCITFSTHISTSRGRPWKVRLHLSDLYFRGQQHIQTKTWTFWGLKNIISETIEQSALMNVHICTQKHSNSKKKKTILSSKDSDPWILLIFPKDVYHIQGLNYRGLLSI